MMTSRKSKRIAFIILALIAIPIIVMLLALLTGGMMDESGDPEITSAPAFATVVIDKCEYIQVDEGWAQYRTYAITHKGDCKNPIHQCGGVK